MRRLILFVCVLSVLVWAQNTPLQPMWFDSIKKPAAYSEADMMALTARVYAALRRGTTPTKFKTGLPEDHTPRVVFLTIGDDEWPSRTYFGNGYSFSDALTLAMQILQSNEKARVAQVIKQAKGTIAEAQRDKRPVSQYWEERLKHPDRWTWLRLQVVQATRTVDKFSFNRSRFTYTDRVGFAFPYVLGFAFTPEQLTGRFMMTPNEFVSKQQIGNIIAESFNFSAMGQWMQIASTQAEFPIYLFETDTYFTADGKTVERLYRGHRLGRVPTARECIEAARDAADCVAPCFARKGGSLEAPFAEWRPENGTDEDLCTVAEFAYGLEQLNDALQVFGITPKVDYLQAAKYALRGVRTGAMKFGENNLFRGISELEEKQKNSSRRPRSFVRTRTNALALIAMLPVWNEGKNAEELEKAKAKGPSLAEQMATFLMSQIRADGSVAAGVVPPGMESLEYDDANWQAKAFDKAVACVALEAASAKFKNTAYHDAALKLHKSLVDELSAVAMRELPKEPWIVAALTMKGAPATKRLGELLSNYAVAFVEARELEPSAPDCLGAPKEYPNYMVSARYTWAMAMLARWHRAFSADYEESLTAEMALATSFQLQGRMDDVVCTNLACPRVYRGFFRTLPMEYVFELSGQAAQILSLCEQARLLQEFHKGVFPDQAMTEKQLALVRPMLNVHPSLLRTQLVTNALGISEEHRSTMGGIHGGRVEPIRMPRPKITPAPPTRR